MMPDLAAAPDLSPMQMLGELMPQVLQLASNSVLKSPKVVAVTWDNDTHRSDIEALFPQYAASKAWTAQTSEYGVGALTVGTPIHLSGNAPASLTDKGDLFGGAVQPEAGVLYGFFVPVGTTVDDGTGSKCCTDYDGYHADAAVGSLDVPYFIACACPMFDGPNIGDLQQLTTVAGHELVETVTDPFQNGFGQTDDAHAIWTIVSDGEVADLCQFNDTTYWQPSDMSYTVQRTWSNRAAAAGHDPCVGDPATPYYQAIPLATDPVTLTAPQSSPWQTQGLKVAMGATGTLRLRIYADAAAGPFTITIDDYNSTWLNGTKLLSFTVPATPVASGDELEATVAVLGQDPSLGAAEAYVVTTTPVAGGLSTQYFGVVGQ
jgi:hypothetical protein